ncbi:hypothetical protein V8D89_013845 [Ganoderma adspersum]
MPRTPLKNQHLVLKASPAESAKLKGLWGNHAIVMEAIVPEDNARLNKDSNRAALSLTSQQHDCELYRCRLMPFPNLKQYLLSILSEPKDNEEAMYLPFSMATLGSAPLSLASPTSSSLGAALGRVADCVAIVYRWHPQIHISTLAPTTHHNPSYDAITARAPILPLISYEHPSTSTGTLPHSLTSATLSGGSAADHEQEPVFSTWLNGKKRRAPAIPCTSSTIARQSWSCSSMGRCG